LSIKSCLYARYPEIAVASEFYGVYHNFRKAGFRKTPFGFLMAGLTSMQDGNYQKEETLHMVQVMKTVDVFIDVGANMGYYTCLARSLGKQVLAVEPLWGNLQFIYGNLEVNGWNDVEVLPLGLSDKPGLAVLYGTGTAASLIKDWAGVSTKKRTIPLSTLDILTGLRFEGKRILIKIDVEGMEYRLLQGASNMLGSVPAPVWIVEIGLTGYFPSGVNEYFLNVFDLFWGNGYSAFIMKDNMEEVLTRERVLEWREKLDAEGQFNFLFRKKE